MYDYELRSYGEPEREIYFVTIRARRTRVDLTVRPMIQIIEDGFQHAMESWAWQVGYYAILRDHVHFFLAPLHRLHAPPGSRALELPDFLREWKRWTSQRAESLGERVSLWQADYYSKRLTSAEDYQQLRSNPCHLVDRIPHEGEMSPLDWY